MRDENNTNQKGFYIEIDPKDLPLMPGFRYVWFCVEYVYRVYAVTRWNVMHLRYGRMKELFVKLFICLFHMGKMIDWDYAREFGKRMDRYEILAKRAKHRASSK